MVMTLLLQQLLNSPLHTRPSSPPCSSRYSLQYRHVSVQYSPSNPSSSSSLPFSFLNIYSSHSISPSSASFEDFPGRDSSGRFRFLAGGSAGASIFCRFGRGRGFCGSDGGNDGADGRLAALNPLREALVSSLCGLGMLRGPAPRGRPRFLLVVAANQLRTIDGRTS
jgi:hypothetical protein